MIWKYPDEQIDFIRKIAPGRFNDEIVEIFNKKFETNFSSKQIKSIKANHKIKSDVDRTRRNFQQTLFNDEQIEYLRAISPGKLTDEITQLMNTKFGMSFTIKQIRGAKKRYCILSSVDMTYKKGNIPANKGTKGVYNVGGNLTSFKKGNRPNNTLAVGDEIHRDDGYLWVKVAEPNKWKQKHRILWEKVNGPIPEDQVLIFLDGDKTNCSIENLKLVTKSQHARLNQNHWRFNNPEATEIGISLAKLKEAQGKRKKKVKNKC